MMKNILSIAIGITLSLSMVVSAQEKDPVKKSLEGRWDLNLMMNGEVHPSWLEINHSGFKTLTGRFVAVWGSARPVAEIKVNGNTFTFAMPPQWEQGEQDMSFSGTIENDKLSGEVIFPDGNRYTWTGVRAPSLRSNKKPRAGKPVTLIQKNSSQGWRALGENQWVVENGILKSPKSGANLVSEATFKDFKLHVEFRYPAGSNSGVYLRGRYEVQIADSKNKGPMLDELGAVYGFLTPSEQVAKEPGEWQTYDITLVGRMITVVANGKMIICNQEIPGITGGALDSREHEPGPLLLQGDHGPVEFRNMVLTPLE